MTIDSIATMPLMDHDRIQRRSNEMWRTLTEHGFTRNSDGKWIPPVRKLWDGGECHGLDTPSTVHFYEHEFYVLSNFSAFNVQWQGITFDTSEAAYHWEKFPKAPHVRSLIIKARSAHDALKIATEHAALRRDDWDRVKVDIMLSILRAKVTQHEYVRRKLMETDNRRLVEDSWRDDFWGWGANRDGANWMGRLWMRLRDEIKERGDVGVAMTATDASPAPQATNAQAPDAERAEPYRIEKTERACLMCDQGEQWAVVTGEGEDFTEVGGETYGSEEQAQHLADCMNAAHKRGHTAGLHDAIGKHVVRSTGHHSEVIGTIGADVVATEYRVPVQVLRDMKPGNVVVLTMPKGETQEAVDFVGRKADEIVPKGVKILVLTDDEKITVCRCGSAALTGEVFDELARLRGIAATVAAPSTPCCGEFETCEQPCLVNAKHWRERAGQAEHESEERNNVIECARAELRCAADEGLLSGIRREQNQRAQAEHIAIRNQVELDTVRVDLANVTSNLEDARRDLEEAADAK